MKVLIGTPIHKSQDKPIKKWLKNVSENKYEADLYLVDTSPDEEYVKKVKEYCKKYKIKDYKINHLDINQEQGMDEMVGRSREKIRQYVLSKGYDAWFSWEPTQTNFIAVFCPWLLGA